MQMRRRWSGVARVVAALGTVFMAACAGDGGPTEPQVRDVVRGGDVGVTATSMMAAIGCSLNEGEADSSTVGVLFSPTVMKTYRCPGVPRDSILKTSDAIRALVRSGSVWASAQSEPGEGGNGSGFWVYSYAECRVVYSEQVGIYLVQDGSGLPTIVKRVTRRAECDWVEHYIWNGPSGSNWNDFPLPGEPGGGPPYTPPDTTPVPPPDTTEVDESSPFPVTVQQDAYDGSVDKPDCTRPLQLTAEESVWCNSFPPNQTQADRINRALQRMRQKGGVCADRANLMQALLDNGGMRIFSSSVYAGDVGLSPRGGGTTSWTAISEALVNTHYERRFAGNVPGTSVKITLQFTLAHEGDHLAQTDKTQPPHIDAQGFYTTNSVACSDVPNQGPVY